MPKKQVFCMKDLVFPSGAGKSHVYVASFISKVNGKTTCPSTVLITPILQVPDPKMEDTEDLHNNFTSSFVIQYMEMNLEHF